MNSSANRFPFSEVGDLSEIGGEIKFEWKIKNFATLSNESVCYVSPRFYFSGACWRIEIFPNGEMEMNSEGWLGLYLRKQSSDSDVSLNFTLGIQTVDLVKTHTFNSTRVFKPTSCGFGLPKFITRSKLLEKKSKLLPSDILTVICTMKNSEPKDAVDSYFNRLLDVSDNLKEIYLKAKKADFKMKVESGEIIYAHRLILKTRSPVFAAMLSHDTQENQANEVSIKDLGKSAIDNILYYMYTGDIRYLTTDNVLSVYSAAEKYDIKYAKKVCVKFIMENLSADWVCDIIKFADLHNEDELGRCAKEYFAKNADKILDSDKWKSFINENSLMGVEILSSVVKFSQPKITENK